MSGTYILEVQTVTAKSGTWTTQLGATDNPSLVLAVYDPGHPATRYIFANGNAAIQFSLAYFLDGSGSSTPFSSLPSGFLPSSCLATVTTAAFDPNDTGTVSFAASQKSSPFSTFAAHTFNYPAALVAQDILNGGLGLQFVRSGGAGNPTWYLLSASGNYTTTVPTVSAISPNSGPVAGGQAVTVTGTGFGAGGALSVTIGGAAATSVTYVSDTSLTCVTPVGIATGVPVDVVVTLTGTGSPVSGTGSALYTYLAYFSGSTIASIPANTTKELPDFVWYTFQATQPAGWTPAVEPAHKGWFWTDASDPTVAPFTSKAKSFLTVT